MNVSLKKKKKLFYQKLNRFFFLCDLEENVMGEVACAQKLCVD